MRKRILSGAALGVVALLATSAPAFAQDARGESHFDGLYVGGSFGMSVQPNDVNESILFDRTLDGNFNDTVTTVDGANAFAPGFCNGAANGATPAGACRNDKDGMEYFARVGADHQIGNFVYGVMGEFGKSEVRDSVSAFSTTPANYVMTREFDWNASIRGRVGYAAGGRSLFYAAGGPTYARINNSFSSTNTANAFALEDAKSNSWGYAVGGGLEQKIGDNFSFGLEYMFNNYVDDDFRVNTSAGTAPASNPFLLGAGSTDLRRSDNDFRFHSIRMTGAFRF
ncbi:outer membrane protein [Sphingomonas sp. 37zxx]|uniref:outer membrane protein n=1 Tax=Sphingomonas sp. 37zxx TaxID=1550073 RepID=UPI00053BF9C8|nr:outer membrane beta-barrel protein [Sphingomonas sp. 37zxx]